MKVLLILFSLAMAQGSSWAGLKKIIDCAPDVEQDLNRVANHADANWDEVEEFLEDFTGFNIKGCLKNRFQKNGKVVCEQSSGGNCSGALGWASYLGKKAHFCPAAISNFEAIDRTPDQRACYFTLLVHEFAHSCWRNEAKAEDLENAAFAYWASTHNVTIDPQRDCGFD